MALVREAGSHVAHTSWVRFTGVSTLGHMAVGWHKSLLDPRGIERVIFTQEKRALERKMSEMEEEMKVRSLPGPAGTEQPSARPGTHRCTRPPRRAHGVPGGVSSRLRADWVSS